MLKRLKHPGFVFLLAVAFHAPSTMAADGQPAVAAEKTMSAFLDAVDAIHQQRKEILAHEALPEHRPLTGRIEDILPITSGTPIERSTEFITRMGKHGLAIDIGLSHRIAAATPDWLIAPQTLASADETARAHRSVDEPVIVFAEAVATERAFRAHLRQNLQAIWEGEPTGKEFMMAYTRSRANIQPIIDELAANRGRLAASVRNILDFADGERDHLQWDEATGQLLVETDEDVARYNSLVEAVQRAEAQEQAILTMLMAELDGSVEALRRQAN